MGTDVFREIKPWKKPLHRGKASLAKAYLKLLANTKIIAITGSVGKTLTQEMVSKVLSQKYKVAAGDQNLDPTFRIPQTILSAKPWHKYMVLEFGVEHPGDMDYYLSLVKPNIAVYTLIGPTHLKYFKNIEGVYAEKSKLAKALKPNNYLILNSDDQFSNKLKEVSKAQVIIYGQTAKNGVKISRFSQNLQGSKYRLHYKGQTAQVETKLIGKPQLLSAFAAATVGILAGVTIKQIATGLSQVKAPAHRLNLINLKNLSIIDDTYNSSPIAAAESIETLMELGIGQNKVAVLGEMKDLGPQSLTAHKNLAEQLAKTKINLLITVGKTAKIISDWAVEKGFTNKVENVANTQEALNVLKPPNHKKSVILVKGSRHAHLERVVLGLEGKPTIINCYHCGRLK